MLARDARVVRRDFPAFATRTIMQPLLFVFVFAYVLPKISTAAQPTAGNAPTSFATILVPGMVALSMLFSGIMAVTTPLVNELSFAREIEDRLLAPIPSWLLAVEKLVSGALQSLLAGVLVLPVVYAVHAKDAVAQIQLSGWPLLVTVFVLAATLSSALGLLVGVVVDPRHINVVFTVIVLPLTMLGCVYYPWATLENIPWLQYLALFNPLVYASEGLRAALTSQLPHMHTWALLSALTAGTAIAGWAGTRLFLRRAVS
jgi:ABC-2 type transport system permease protein